MAHPLFCFAQMVFILTQTARTFAERVALTPLATSRLCRVCTSRMVSTSIASAYLRMSAPSAGNSKAQLV